MRNFVLTISAIAALAMVPSFARANCEDACGGYGENSCARGTVSSCHTCAQGVGDPASRYMGWCARYVPSCSACVRAQNSSAKAAIPRHRN